MVPGNNWMMIEKRIKKEMAHQMALKDRIQLRDFVKLIINRIQIAEFKSQR